MINNINQSNKKRSCEGQFILPFLPEWYCFLCRTNKIENPIVKGYLGGKREKQNDKVLNLHLTCTLFIPELHLHFSSQNGFEVFNLSKVQTEDYQCFICQDSGNPKKGYSIKCIQGSCNTKIHLACINKTRIYKKQNEQNLLKCYIMCRNHARLNPQPFETTYEKLYNEIQKEWIEVYKQLEEQEKYRLQEEKALQHSNIKGKNNLEKKKQANRAHNKHTQQESQYESNQLEYHGTGNINYFAGSSAIDNNQESNSQLNQNLELQDSQQDSNYDRKRRGRPPKVKDISSFSAKNSQINQKQSENMSQSGDKNELFDSTCKKVFIETSQDIRAFNRDNQLFSPFDSSVGGISKNEASILINRDEDLQNISEKINLEKQPLSNQTTEAPQENAYMQLFGAKVKTEEKILEVINTSAQAVSPFQQNFTDPSQSMAHTNSILDSSLLSNISKRIFRQDLNKKNEKQGTQSSLKKGPNRKSSTFDSNATNGNIMNSIYDNPFNKFLFNKLIEDKQAQQENTQIKKPTNSQQNHTKADKDESDQEEEEQYLECGYPNFNDEKREENMENWWFKIDSEYFTPPTNPSSIIQDLLLTLNIQNDYQKTQYISTNPTQKELSKKKNYDYKYIYCPKQMSQEVIKEFFTTSIVDLYKKQQKQLNKRDTNEDIFGYQMEDENLEEDTNINENQEIEEQNTKESKEKKSALKKETQKQKKLNKKLQNENTKESKKNSLIEEKNDQLIKTQDDQNEFENIFKEINAQKENSDLKADSENIMNQEDIKPIQQENIEKNNQEDIKTIKEEENQNQQLGLIQDQNNEIEQMEQENVVKQEQSDNESIDIEKDVFKDDPVEQKQEMDVEQNDQLIEKKEEENDDQINNNDIQNSNSQLKIEETQLDIKSSHQDSQRVQEENNIKDEDQCNSTQINDILEKDNIQSQHDTKFAYNRQKQFQSLQQSEKKQYIDYYSQEYIHQFLPLKINKKFNVLFHSVNGDGYLMIYDVNENSDIKRSMTSKNKSEYQIYASLKDSEKISQFNEIYSQSQAPGIDENNRRRAIPTLETTPQLMFSKIIHLNDEAIKMSIQEQLDINKNLYNISSYKKKVKGDQIDQMGLRTLFFEKQWCQYQNRFLDWQNFVYKQIEEDKDIAYYKKQSTIIWDMLKLSQTKKTIILGYAYKEKYNTEIYFMTSSEEGRENERGYNQNSSKKNIPSKMPSQQSTNLTNEFYNQDKKLDQNAQTTQNFNINNELNQQKEQSAQALSQQDQRLSQNSGDILENINVEGNFQKINNEEQNNNQQFEQQDQNKPRSNVQSYKNNISQIGKKNRKLYDQNEFEKDSKDTQNQESEQKLKLRIRKPPNKMQQQKPRLTPYMKAKQKQMNSNLHDRNLANSKHPPQKGSTIFETMRKVKIIPIAKRIKRNPQLKQKDQLETDCMICFSQKNTDNNPVVYCSDCQASFHKICYGIEDLPEGKYFCDKCEIIRTLRHKERYQRDILQQRFSCPLCVETELPIKLIYQKQSNSKYGDDDNKHFHHSNGYESANNDQFRNNIDKSISHDQIERKLNSHGELWMHPFCMFTFNLAKFYDGEIILKNTDFPTPANNQQQTHIKKDKASSNSSIASDDIFTIAKCQVCEKNHGRTIKCSDISCDQHFHPLCSFFQGLQCKLVEKPNLKEAQSNHKQSHRNSSMKNNKINADKYAIDEDILIEKDLLEFQIRCKKHILLERIDAQQQEIQNTLKQTSENVKQEITPEIKQIQQNLKQEIDYYLKQIFYRRFGVNYEKICSNFYYYEDFHEEVYEKQNLKIKFYNPHLNEYQTLPEVLQFIEFGPQPKNIPKVNQDAQINRSNSISCQNKNKKTVEFEDYEFQMESDYEDDDEDDFEDKGLDRIQDQEENKDEDEEEEEEYEEKEEEEDEDDEIHEEKDMKDENIETHDSNNDTSYSQNFQVKNQKKGESVLQPVQTYRKPSKLQKQQKKMKFEEDLNENQSETNNDIIYQSNQFKQIDEDNEQILNEDKDLHSLRQYNQIQKQSDLLQKNTSNNEKHYVKNKKESDDDDFFNDIELDDSDDEDDEDDEYDLNSYEDQNQINLNQDEKNNNYKENSEDYRSSS